MAGVYVHFPFCISKCIYCDFYSKVKGDRTSYVNALIKELEERKDYLKGVPPSTIYFGGGTPSIMDTADLVRVVAAVAKHLGMHSVEEFTLEANPDDINLNKAHELKALGVNRLSMGVQSFDDDHLKWMHRRHSAAQAVSAVETLRGVGFDNISIDLIFGFQGLSNESWDLNITKALSLRPEHISCYQMMGRWADLDDEKCLRQYFQLQERLAEAGYQQYEVSNYCLPGRESRHNSAYWKREPYLGVGAGAHSFDGNRQRSWNIADIDKYVESRPFSSETLTDDEIFEERVMLALRTVAGLDLSLLTQEQRTIMKPALERLSKAGYVVVDDCRVRVPKEKLFVSDSVISALL